MSPVGIRRRLRGPACCGCAACTACRACCCCASGFTPGVGAASCFTACCCCAACTPPEAGACPRPRGRAAAGWAVPAAARCWVAAGLLRPRPLPGCSSSDEDDGASASEGSDASPPEELLPPPPLLLLQMSTTRLSESLPQPLGCWSCWSCCCRTAPRRCRVLRRRPVAAPPPPSAGAPSLPPPRLAPLLPPLGPLPPPLALQRRRPWPAPSPSSSSSSWPSAGSMCARHSLGAGRHSGHSHRSFAAACRSPPVKRQTQLQARRAGGRGRGRTALRLQ